MERANTTTASYACLISSYRFLTAIVMFRLAFVFCFDFWVHDVAVCTSLCIAMELL